MATADAAPIEGQFRELLARGLRSERFANLLCEHEHAEGGRERVSGWVLVSIFSLTYGFLVARALDFDWWAYLAAAFVAYVLVLGTGRLSLRLAGEVAVTVLGAALLVAWPSTLGIELGVSGPRAALVTHGLPLALVAGAIVIWRGIRGLRILTLVKTMRVFFFLTLGAVIVPLVSQEIWVIAAKVDGRRALILGGLGVGLVLFLVFLVWRQLDDSVDQVLKDTARRLAVDPSASRDDALKEMRRVTGSGVGGASHILGRDRPVVAHLGLERVRDALRVSPAQADPHVGSILVDSFKPQAPPATSSLDIAHIVRSSFSGWQMAGRLIALLLVIGASIFLSIYVLAALAIDSDVVTGWIGRPVPHHPLLSGVGIDGQLPTGAYMSVALFLGFFATIVFLTFVLTSRDRYATLAEILIDGPIERCLLIAIPYLHLPTNGRFRSAHDLTGLSGAVFADNCRAGKEPHEPVHAGNEGGASVWYRWMASASGDVVFTTRDSAVDTLLAVYTGSNLRDLAPVADNRAGSEWTEGVSFPAVAGEVYSIAVDGRRHPNGEVSRGRVELWWRVQNEHFALAATLAGPSGSITHTNFGAEKEPGEPDHAGDPGGASVWYRWAAPVSGEVTFDIEWSSFDTLVAVYTGSGLDDLSLVADNRTDSGWTTQASFEAVAGEAYWIVVDGRRDDDGDPGQGEFRLRWLVPNDRFETAAALTGASGWVSGSNVDAEKETGERDHAGDPGGASVWYRWMAPVRGEVTFDTAGSSFDTLVAVYTGLSLHDLLPVADNRTDSGWTGQVRFPAVAGQVYWIALDGRRDGGSEAAQGDLVLTWRIPPPNDAFAAAAAIEGASGRVEALNAGASREPGEPEHAGRPGGKSVWYRWAASSDGQLTLDTAGSSFDTLLAVYRGSSLDSLLPLAANDDAIELQSRVRLPVTAGADYMIAVDGFAGATGDVVLNWRLETPPANDNFAAAHTIGGTTGMDTGANVAATKEPGEPDHAGNPGGASVWYRWIAPATGEAIFDTAGSDFDTLLAVYTGASLEGLSVVAANDDVSGSEETTSEVRFAAVAGETYSIAVDGYGSVMSEAAQGSFVLNWRPAA